MLYHRGSLFALQAWLRFGLLKGKPSRSVDDVIAHHVESPGTRAFSPKEVKAIFSSFENVLLDTVITPYDARIGRRVFLPTWIRSIIPRRLGWFLVVRGKKAAA